MSFLTPLKSFLKQRESPTRPEDTLQKESTIKTRRDANTTLSPNSRASFESLPIPAPFSNYLTVMLELFLIIYNRLTKSFQIIRLWQNVRFCREVSCSKDISE